MEAPPPALNNLSTHRADKPSVYDPVDRMTSNSRRIERDHRLSTLSTDIVVDRVKSL